MERAARRGRGRSARRWCPSRCRAALDQGQVLPRDLPLADHRAGARRAPARTLRHHEQAGRVAVEAVHDAGPLGVGTARGAARERLGQGRPARARAPGGSRRRRLVHHQQVLVLVDHRRTAPAARRPRPASRERSTSTSSPAETLPAAGAGLAVHASRRRRRSAAARPRGKGSGSRPARYASRRSPRVLLRHSAEPRCARAAPRPRRGAQATPTTIAASARLKAGQKDGVDEVDHRALARPVGEVAERPAHEQPRRAATAPAWRRAKAK